MPRRIYTDGAAFRPTRSPPTWDTRSAVRIDEDGDGKYDVLGARKPATSRGPGPTEIFRILLHDDNASVVKGRFFLEKANATTSCTSRSRRSIMR